MNAQSTAEIRVLGPAMRWVFLLGTIFVVGAGVQLYVLTAHTDDFFAWTIGVSMSAAFLGAFYWTAGGIAWRSYSKPAWSDVRVGIYGVLVFELLTLAMTFMHFDLFHFDSASFTAQGAAYAWLIIYILDPLLIVVGLYQQQRLTGIDRPRIALLPGWYRGALLLQGVGLVAIGCALFLFPREMNDVWPWPITPLTSRAIGAWMIGLGLIQLQAVIENAWERIDVVVVNYVLGGALQLVAIARFSDDMRWDEVSVWVYIVAVVSILAMGVLGLAEMHKLRTLARTSTE